MAQLPRLLRYSDRTTLTREVFSDVLPAGTIDRRTKSHFDEAFWSTHSRTFAESWTGAGVNEELVDMDALRAEWSSEQPNPRTFTLLQAAWVGAASAVEGVEQRVDGALEAVPAP